MRVIGFFTIHMKVNKDIETESTLYNNFIKKMYKSNYLGLQ